MGLGNISKNGAKTILTTKISIKSAKSSQDKQLVITFHKKTERQTTKKRGYLE